MPAFKEKKVTVFFKLSQNTSSIGNPYNIMQLKVSLFCGWNMLRCVANERVWPLIFRINDNLKKTHTYLERWNRFIYCIFSILKTTHPSMVLINRILFSLVFLMWIENNTKPQSKKKAESWRRKLIKFFHWIHTNLIYVRITQIPYF